MAVNIAVARLLQIKIGADLQDWSPCLVEFRPGYESWSEGGVIRTNSTLILADNLEAPESLDPELNPGRWRPGVPVEIEVRNTLGDWIPHPQGKLQIVVDPDFPDEDGQLTLELGCWLAWASSNAPEGDASGVVYGTSTNTATVANRLLQAADIPSGNINLGTWPYSTAVPYPNEGFDNYPAQAGGLAFSNDGRYLYCDSDGVVQARLLSFADTTPVLTITLGTNDAAGFRRSRDPNSPVELVRSAGVGYPVTPLTAFESDVSNDTEVLDDGETASRQTTITSSFTYDPLGTGNVLVYAGNLVRESAKLALPNVAGASGLITVSDRDDVSVYETAGPPHRLTRFETTTRKARALVNPTDTSTGFTIPITAERATTTYTYDSAELITQIQATEYGREASYDRASSDPYNERLLRRITTNWYEQGTNRWKKVIVTETARIVKNANTRKNKWNQTRDRRAVTSSDGSTAPPAVEFWEGPFGDLQTQYEGEATWVHPGGATGRNRKRLVDVPYGYSTAQMETIAALFRDWLVAGSNSAVIPLPPSDALLAIDYPLFRVDVVDPIAGFRYKYVIDALQWVHTPTEFTAAGMGLQIGKVAL